MKHLLGFYQQEIYIGIATQLHYRVAMLLWVVGNLIQPIISLSVWRITVGGGEIAGFTASDFAAYYIVLFVVDHFTQTWSFWNVEGMIQRGELSRYLLWALNPIHSEIAYSLGFKLLMVVALIPIVGLLVLLFDPALYPPLWALLVFPIVLVIASALSFLWAWAVALSAFWITRVNALARLYLLAMVFFAGRIAPLEVLPESLQTVAAVLPFRWMVAFPVELLLGRVTPPQTVMGIGAQLFWLILALLLSDRLWRIGIRRYSAVGG